MIAYLSRLHCSGLLSFHFHYNCPHESAALWVVRIIIRCEEKRRRIYTDDHNQCSNRIYSVVYKLLIYIATNFLFYKTHHFTHQIIFLTSPYWIENYLSRGMKIMKNGVKMVPDFLSRQNWNKSWRSEIFQLVRKGSNMWGQFFGGSDNVAFSTLVLMGHENVWKWDENGCWFFEATKFEQKLKVRNFGEVWKRSKWGVNFWRVR